MRKLLMKKIGKNEKGFTLAELLIVVAIVAVLVAISVPVFTAKLEKAREAVDVANMRAAKAAGAAQYLDDDATAGQSYWYDADKGILVSASGTKPDGYGKGTKTDGSIVYKGYDATKNYKDSVIKVTIGSGDKAGEVTITWDPEGK